MHLPASFEGWVLLVVVLGLSAYFWSKVFQNGGKPPFWF